MQKIFSPENLSRVSARWPKWTLLLWGIAFIGAIALVVFQFSAVTTTEFKFLNEPDSERANALLTERLQGLTDFNEVVIVKSPTLTVDMPQFQDYVDGLQAEILGLGGSVIAGTSNFYDTGNETLVSDDRHTILMPIAMAGEFKDAEANAPRVRDILDSSPGGADFEVYLTGEATFSRDYTEFTQKDLLKGEALAIPIAMVILVIVFGALAAALLPMIIAIASIVISLGIVMIVGQGFEFHVFVQNMITMIDLFVKTPRQPGARWG